MFTNGIEWLGMRLKVGEGVIGSILSAVGTCLPETMVPILAILFAQGSRESLDVGIGAIAGAPFMLSTLAFFITGASVLLFWRKRRTGITMSANPKILMRDISFFIAAYTIGISATVLKASLAKIAIAIFLLLFYVFYIIKTIKHDRAGSNSLGRLYITNVLHTRPRFRFIVLQLAFALTGIILGAHFFVVNIEKAAPIWGISTLVLSLIITPIATELPEKFNSVIWIRRQKDTLALGNITGAMVFQSCIPVSIGIMATSWKLDLIIVVSAFFAILSAMATYIWLYWKNRLSPFPLLSGGVFYAAFIFYVFVNNFK